MFGISRKHMAWLCHTLGTMLDAGLPMSRAMDVLVAQAPTGRLRGALARSRRAVDGGATLAEALEAQRCFPKLFLQLIAAGEQSGTLDRTTAEAARFYEFQQRLWRNFAARIALPATQYVVAVAIITFATYLVNTLMEKPASVLPGLVLGYGAPVLLVALYQFAVKPLGGTRWAHEIMLHTPIVSRVVRPLAMARFSLVMYLMFEAGVPVTQALVWAFEATDNAAFASRGPAAAAAVEGGATLTEALDATRLFPREYMDIVQVAEESGKLSERFEWSALHYADKAEFALGMLVGFIAKMIYVAVALIIIIFIFKFFSMYAGALSGAMA